MNLSPTSTMSLELVLLCVVATGCPSTTPAPDADADPPAAKAPTEPASAPAPTPRAELTELADLAGLRDAFNADADKGRVILLLEPG